MNLNLDELEFRCFWGRTHSGGAYTVGDKWIWASCSRDSAQAVAQLVEPIGGHGWTVVLEKRSHDDEYAWEPFVIGGDLNLSYFEAEQAAYEFLMGGEVEFEFHRGFALSVSSGSAEMGWFQAMLSECYDERRYVHFKREGGGWFAQGSAEIWNEDMIWFVNSRAETMPRFPDQGFADLDKVRAMAYDWAIMPALEQADRSSAWWLDRDSIEAVARNVTYFGGGKNRAA